MSSRYSTKGGSRWGRAARVAEANRNFWETRRFVEYILKLNITPTDST